MSISYANAQENNLNGKYYFGNKNICKKTFDENLLTINGNDWVQYENECKIMNKTYSKYGQILTLFCESEGEKTKGIYLISFDKDVMIVRNNVEDFSVKFNKCK